jgi:hypothetical protein
MSHCGTADERPNTGLAFSLLDEPLQCEAIWRSLELLRTSCKSVHYTGIGHTTL